MVFQEPLRYTRITPHFFWNEMLASVEADKNNIINAPITEAQTENIITTANHMEKIRERVQRKQRTAAVAAVVQRASRHPELKRSGIFV
jgi:vacuolar-type H+-ATPase subunit F/Vma7